MKQKWDKFKKYLAINKKLFVFLTILFVIALISGSVFSIVLNEKDNALVTDYLNNYINSIDQNTIVFKETLFNSLTSNILLNIVIWILGISIIGVPIILFLFFYKCFIIGFSISSILLRYKLKGIIMSIIYIFPHHIVNIILLIILINYAYFISVSIINAIVKKKELNFSSVTSKYLSILGVICILMVFTSLYESFITPKLIKLIIPLIS